MIYSLQHEDNPLDISLKSFESLNGLLTESGTYDYLELYAQYLEMPNQTGVFYEVGTNELNNKCSGIQCIQVSNNLIAQCDIKVSDGRLFEKKDFLYEKGDKLPVLMGQEYSAFYKIGDIFEAEYLFDEYKFEIIWFVSEESNISIADNNIDLEKCIVMPSFIIDASVLITDGLKIHYANKTSGLVRLSETNADEFYETIEPMLKNAKVGNYSWTITPAAYQYKEIL